MIWRIVVDQHRVCARRADEILECAIETQKARVFLEIQVVKELRPAIKRRVQERIVVEWNEGHLVVRSGSNLPLPVIGLESALVERVDDRQHGDSRWRVISSTSSGQSGVISIGWSSPAAFKV